MSYLIDPNGFDDDVERALQRIEELREEIDEKPRAERLE